MRRRSTAVAHTGVELLNIEKGDLIKLFKQGIGSDLRRVCTVLLDAFMARERLRYFGTALRIAFVRSPEVKAACLIQLQWRRFCESEAQETNELYKLISNQRARSKSVAMMPRRPSIVEPSRMNSAGEPSRLGFSGPSAPTRDNTGGILAAIAKLAAQYEASQTGIHVSIGKLAAQQEMMEASIKSLMEKSSAGDTRATPQVRLESLDPFLA